MRIVWDEPKRLANIDKHQFDLAEVTAEFIDNATFYPAKLGRIAAVGLFGDRLMTAIIEPLGTEAVAVISFRPASLRNGDDFGLEEVHPRPGIHQRGLGCGRQSRADGRAARPAYEL